MNPGHCTSVTGMMKTGKIAPGVGIEPTTLALQANVLTTTPPRVLDVPILPVSILPVYVTPCLRGQCRLLHLSLQLNFYMYMSTCTLCIRVCGDACVYFSCLLEFYILATIKVISGRVPTWDSVHSRRPYIIVFPILGEPRLPATITQFTTQSQLYWYWANQSLRLSY